MAAQDQPLNSAEVQDHIQALTEVNMGLSDKNEHLFSKLSILESRVSRMTGSNSELSALLLQSEEDKLKLSKELIEQKSKSNKMMEKFEEELMTLKDKILTQGSMISQLETERDKLKGDLQAAEACVAVGERSGQELSQDYTQLKDHFQSLVRAHDRERSHNEELSAELLTLAQAQDALRRQLEEQQQTVQATTTDLHTELDRVRTIVSRMSRDRVKPEDLAALDKEQKTLGENLLGHQDQMKAVMESMKENYEEQQKTLERRVSALGKDREERRLELHSTEEETRQNMASAFTQSYAREIEAENSELQLKLKELNEKYRSRLNCYIQDLADYMDGLESKTSPDAGKMKRYVDSMLQDMCSSFKAREEQLATAARVYKKRLRRIIGSHHALLAAYRGQREQILAKPEMGLNAGPPEASFSLDPSEMKTEMETEMQLLRQDKARLELQLQATTGQADFEKERALLLTRAAVAEAQVSEMQEYIDAQLARSMEKSTSNNMARTKHNREKVQTELPEKDQG